MRKLAHRSDRRTDALSKEKIVEAAIDILDAAGEGGLTFRALATRLATGSGAIYWHVADKTDLLAAATNAVLGHAMSKVASGADPKAVIRAIALGVFDAIDTHPWVGAQFSLEPGQSGLLQVFEGIGGQLLAMGVPKEAQFDAWSTLVNYILGVAVQNAANARQLPGEIDRETTLSTIAERWAQLEPAAYPFLRQVASQLPGHDDRDQFLAGVDIILAGLSTLR